MVSKILVAGAITVATAVVGSPVASADSYAGQTYADAASAAGSSGMTVVVGGKVGSELPTDQCIVTRSQKAAWIKGDNFQPSNTMVFFLNCNAALASAGKPGNSAASAAGQQALKEQESYEWKSTTEGGAEWCAENMKAHPDWGGNAFNGCPGTGT